MTHSGIPVACSQALCTTIERSIIQRDSKLAVVFTAEWKGSLLPLSSHSTAELKPFPTWTVCLWFLTMWKELSVRLRTSLPSKWIQFQSCARCKMDMLKQTSPLHMQTLPIATSLLEYCSLFSFTLFCPFPHLFPSLLRCLQRREWRVTEWHTIMTNNEIKSPLLPNLGRQDERMWRGKMVEGITSIHGPLITCCQDFGAGTGPSFFFVSWAEKERWCFFNFSYLSYHLTFLLFPLACHYCVLTWKKRIKKW